MSILFGRCSFDYEPADPVYRDRVQAILGVYGPDGVSSWAENGALLLYYPFHTTKDSRLERQPYVTNSGALLMWDGRLDNRTELARTLGNHVPIDGSDGGIVAVAYEKWGTHCFARLIGDWAISVWHANSRSLILAKDPIGTRHLHFAVDQRRVTWSSVLDPLVLLGERSMQLDKEYIAGWLSMFPSTHLTPYVGIRSVPPSSFVLVNARSQETHRYWDFDPGRKIIYRTDGEYEEHFRRVFGESVRRRLRSEGPVLAELSGGMDSSSIVCMADTLIERGLADVPRLDTVSYYDDSEPNWNERPYFVRVEQGRGRTGCHIDASSRANFNFDFDSAFFAATPDALVRRSPTHEQFVACLESQQNRIVLSGIGGDEVAGGIPTPIPELADLLASVNLRALARQLRAWALDKKQPWFHLLIETIRDFLPPWLASAPKWLASPAWLNPAFVKCHGRALKGYPSRTKLFGALPSLQENLTTLEALRRALECFAPPSRPTHEMRYPFLDRDLLEFLYAVPRQQIVRPGQRRSLMRRALVGIVPDELLQRRRKAFVSRGPIVGFDCHWADFLEFTREMRSSAMGIVDPQEFVRALEKARHGMDTSIVLIMRTIAIELWLRSLEKAPTLTFVASAGTRKSASLFSRTTIVTQSGPKSPTVTNAGGLQ